MLQIAPNVHRPPILDYHLLIEQLARTQRNVREGQDNLATAGWCLHNVVNFLDANPAVFSAGLTRPLRLLLRALRDLELGARPALFFQRAKKGPGRPGTESFNTVRGVAAALVSALMEAGQKRAEAAALVAKELRRLDIRMPSGKAPGGNEIAAKHILRWRDEIGARASKLTSDMSDSVLTHYTGLLDRYRHDPDSPTELVRTALSAVRAEGF
jgi:hypothetical protein